MTGTPDSPVLDLDHLRRQTAGDGALARDLLALFTVQCGRLRPLLREGGTALRRADAAHTVKGSAHAIGALRLAGLADRLEHGLRQGEPSPTAALVEEIEAAFETTLRAVAESLRAGAV